MSHTLRKINLGNSALAEATIVDYMQGGESFTLAELGLTGGVQSILFLKPYSANSAIQPAFQGGKVILQDLSDPTNALPEIASRAGINFVLVAFIHGT